MLCRAAASGGATRLEKFSPALPILPEHGPAAGQLQALQLVLWETVARAMAAEVVLRCLATCGTSKRQLGAGTSRKLAATANIALGPGMRAASALLAAARKLPADARQRAAAGRQAAVAALLSARLVLRSNAATFWGAAGQLLGGLEEEVPG